ncbi:hypothetical protein RclHR1_08020005 [Rhizophagus clarus]|uniref:Uncharacterized protein n=1 Tax=Rhizophagus clarus TaxID=94130 RepID=A0A2Z6SEU2_9GLOM|nr:hypothetical protein RclHR1_08020005 [Rhizophagus clarus]GET03526.1 hypothetical protein GLOIN_2v1769180 [Rhizophagus clarus]
MSFIPQQFYEVVKLKNQLPATMEQNMMQHHIFNNSSCELLYMKIGELPFPSILIRNRALGRPRKQNPYCRDVVVARYLSGAYLLPTNYNVKPSLKSTETRSYRNASTVKGNKMLTFYNTFSGKYEMHSGTRKNVHSVTKSFQHFTQIFQSYSQQPSLQQVSSLQPFRQQPSLQPFRPNYQPSLFTNTVNSELPQQFINN